MGKKINNTTIPNKNKEDNTFWRLYAIVYDFLRYVPIYQKMLLDVGKASDIRNTDTVLDAGCGTGNFIDHIISKGSKAKFIGIDVADTMLSRAQEKINKSDVNFQQVNLNKQLPFKDNYVDTIIAINSLYAVSNPQFTVSELWRILKPKGTLVIVNPQDKTKFFEAYFGILNSGRGLQKIFLFFITIPLFIFNAIIKMKANKLDYHFMTSEEWKELLQEFNAHSVEIKDTYVQSYLIKIVK